MFFNLGCAILIPMGFFDIFKNRDGESRYEREKVIAQSSEIKKRLNLAKSSKTHQEILYYLAQHDPAPEVRLAVARNKAMPIQASPVLAEDKNENVRLALAERLVTLLPNLSPDHHSQLFAFAAQALGTLALDEVLKIRKALASTLKDYAHTPPKVANRLARDVERQVSEPILRFCTTLSDADLLEVLKTHPAEWALQAIAGRKNVSGTVASAIIETEDEPAGVILLENPDAEIGTQLLETIVAKARYLPEWQKPAAFHKSLSPEIAEKLAAFADLAVRDVLTQREDFDGASIETIASIFRRRLEFMDQEAHSEQSPAEKAEMLFKKGTLDETAISDALAARNNEFVEAALALLVNTDTETIKKAFDTKAAKAITALAWRAGLSMRMALRLQQEMGRVPPKELIYPRGGTDYPMTEEEILWQLDFLGLNTKKRPRKESH